MSNEALSSFKQQRLKYPKNEVIGHVNINSFKNMFTDFKELLLNKTELILISGNKIWNTFSNAHFQAERYRLFHKDRHKLGWGVALFNL